MYNSYHHFVSLVSGLIFDLIDQAVAIAVLYISCDLSGLIVNCSHIGRTCYTEENLHKMIWLAAALAVLIQLIVFSESQSKLRFFNEYFDLVVGSLCFNFGNLICKKLTD